MGGMLCRSVPSDRHWFVEGLYAWLLYGHETVPQGQSSSCRSQDLLYFLKRFQVGTVLYLCLQAKAIAQPFAYEEYRKEKIRKKVEEARASRIRLKVHRPIVGWDIFMRKFFFLM